MKKSIPFTRNIAAALAFLLLHTSICGAAALAPGSIGILECTAADHEMRAAWEKASSEVRLDPLLLVLNENVVSSILAEWHEAGETVEAAWRTADRSVLVRTQSLLDEAWKAYYAFSFEKAFGFLMEAEGLLASPGDSRFRSRLTFEVSILKGMVRRAVNDGGSRDEFKKAAAVSPSAELSPERYSPEIISAYSRAKSELISGETVLIDIDPSPADAVILVDGKSTEPETGGSRLRIFPGKHFLEAKAPGYEPFSYVLEAVEWDSPSLKFSLKQSGPEKEPDRFFLGRLKTGDRSYLSRLLEKLDVNYVLIPDGAEDALRVWVVGRDGHTVAHGTIWEPGDDPESAVMSLTALVKPLRQDREDVQQSTVTQMNLPSIPEIALKHDGESAQHAGWKRYSVILGILILAAAVSASESSGGGGTTVEVTW